MIPERNNHNEIDTVTFGRMVEKIENLVITINRLDTHLKESKSINEQLTKRIDDLEDRLRIGKATMLGLLIGLGFAAVGLKQTIATLLSLLK